MTIADRITKIASDLVEFLEDGDGLPFTGKLAAIADELRAKEQQTKVTIGLYVEDGLVSVSSSWPVDVHLFDKDVYDEASEEERAEMEAERKIVESLNFQITEV